MGLKVRGDLLLRKKLLNTGTAVNKAGADALRAGARRIQKMARDYAPLEYGALENAIKLEEQNGSRNTWNEIVYVDRNEPAPERGSGAIVGDYAVYAHEGITSGQGGGGIGSGPGSREKAARLGVEVGPKFLDRAFKENVPIIRRQIIEAVNAAIAANEEKVARRAAATRLLANVNSAKAVSNRGPRQSPRSRGRGRTR